MSQQQNLPRLITLAQLDVDAVHAYTRAIEGVDNPQIRERLVKYQDDHRRHVRDLSEVIVNLGGTPPGDAPDLTGLLAEGSTALLGAVGTAGVMTAMLNNELLTTSSYADAVTWSVPEDVKAVLERNYRDEQEHLSYIKSELNIPV